MQEIQAIQASPPLATTQENTTYKSALATSADKSVSQDDSIKVTLSSRAESHKDIQAIKAGQQAQENKRVQDHEIDYSLAMSGIPQYGGKLVTVIKHPDGRTEMIDTFSGKKVTQEALAQAQRLEENSETGQSQENQPGQTLTPGDDI